MATAGVAMGAGKKAALAALGAFSGVGAAVAYKLDQSVKADLTLHPPHLHWTHSGLLDSLDHASIRRGYQVILFPFLSIICNFRCLKLHLAVQVCCAPDLLEEFFWCRHDVFLSV